MMTIHSAGGPLIAIDKRDLRRWGGINRKSFTSSPGRTDYEVAGRLTDGRDHRACLTTIVDGGTSEGILISMPLETAVIVQEKNCIQIAQIEFGDPEWTFDLLSPDAFKNASFAPEDDVCFSCANCEYVLFDSAYDGLSVKDDHLVFSLFMGEYIISSAAYEPDERTGLILHQIQKR